MKVYDFSEQLVLGQQGERELDEFFAPSWDIYPASIEDERAGIDRVFKGPNEQTTWQYKTDFKAHSTGNAFIELWVYQESGNYRVPGWARKIRAENLAYWIPGEGRLYLVIVSKFKALLSDWESRFPIRRSQNVGYRGEGILLPHSSLRACSSVVVTRFFPKYFHV